MKTSITIAIICMIAGAAVAADFEAAAREVLRNIIVKDYSAAAKNFDERMMAALPPARLQQVFETRIQPQLGAFQSVREVKTVADGPYTVVTLVSNFARGLVNVQVAFDPAGKVAGLFFKPAQMPTEPAATRFSDYQTKTNLRLPFDGEWFVFWGGRTREQNYHVIARDQQPLYAPADGVVSESVDGISDNTPGVMNPSAPAGNHVVIDHGNGEFSLLAHFRSGTVVPKAGDHVKRGDLLGRCGNSGNTSEPHLHYHLQNAPHFGECEGLPAQFQNYFADGKKVERGEPGKGQKIRN